MNKNCFQLAQTFTKCICEKYNIKYEEFINDYDLLIVDECFSGARAKCIEFFEENLGIHTDFTDSFIDMCFFVTLAERDNKHEKKLSISLKSPDRIFDSYEKVSDNQKTQTMINHIKSIYDTYTISDNDIRLLLVKNEN